MTRQQPWGERLAQGAAGAADQPSLRTLLHDAVAIVRSRWEEVRRHGVGPLLEEAAAQVRPATREELAARYPGLAPDEVARRLIERAARQAMGTALALGGLVAVQEAVAAARATRPPRAVAALGSVGATAAAEVVVLFLLEAKLRADLGALAGLPPQTPRELVASVLEEVQAAGGLGGLRGRSLQRAVPQAATRRIAARVASMVPARFARVVIPEVVAPVVGSAWAGRLAARQVRAAGERHWAALRSRAEPWAVPPAARPAEGNGQPPASLPPP